MIILGINAYHPDASVALLNDGVLIWAGEEERYSRIKHASGFPNLALRHCLQETKTSPSDIDAIAISRNPKANLIKKILFTFKNNPQPGFLFDRLKASRKASRFQEDFLKVMEGLSFPPLKAKFFHVEHHQTHAASSFFFSGFEKAAFLSIDGMGDFSSAMWGVGENNQIHVLDRVFFPHSLGFFYTAGTQFLGFSHFGDEYKVMGLAAYGRPIYLDLFRSMIRKKANGRFELDLSFFIHQKGQSIKWDGGAPEQDIMYSPRWTEFLGNPRKAGEPITARDQNIAASLQTVTEEIYFHILNHLYKITGQKNLCLAGGVAFNSVANGKIVRNTPFKNVYIQPAAGDAGTSLGAAAFVCHQIKKLPRAFVMNHAFFGSEAKSHEIEKAVRSHQLSSESLSEDVLIEKVAEDLASGKVVGWFQGKMEFGPRALGNRSLLADPRNPKMKDILNQRVKRREDFRPFAPAVPEEKAPEYFEMDGPSSPFMCKVFPVRLDKRAAIPTVTHVDGSARVQTVSKKDNPLFWKLLVAFGEKTGHPVLLNTSFNEDEPVVCTPEDAVDCFLRTHLDVLVMGSWYAQRPLTRKKTSGSDLSLARLEH